MRRLRSPGLSDASAAANGRRMRPRRFPPTPSPDGGGGGGGWHRLPGLNQGRPTESAAPEGGGGTHRDKKGSPEPLGVVVVVTEG